MTARHFGIDTLVRTNAVLHARRPAVVDGALRLTWAELDARADRLADHLLARGIGPGDRVALLLVDGAAFLELLIACARVGAVAVTLNWRLAAAEIGWILGDAAPAVVFHSPRYEPLLAEAPGVETFAVVEPYSAASAYHALATGHAEPCPRPAPDPARALYMMYTSGTTGRPKGCLQSDAGTAIAGMAFAIRHAFRAEERLLSTNPLFHVAGMHQAMAMLACGGCCVFPARDDDPLAIRELALRERCTTGSAVPQIIVPWRDSDPLPDWRTYTTGAGTGRPRFWEWLAEGWGTRVIGGYGQTEIGGFATFIDYADMLEAPGSIGWPMAHVAMAILDPDGNELPDGEEGEIALRGASVMLGYWNNPARAARGGHRQRHQRPCHRAARGRAGLLCDQGGIAQLHPGDPRTTCGHAGPRGRGLAPGGRDPDDRRAHRQQDEARGMRAPDPPRHRTRPARGERGHGQAAPGGQLGLALARPQDNVALLMR
ncbi:long-chain fatty acid--CoA ligase [Leptolyngbya sp. 15MV]|nr:long-chain fatty acid--CoA ligase [Leptolyngbya sp. 15MV]